MDMAVKTINNMLLHSELKPINPEAQYLADTIIRLLKADADLAEAQSRAPRYTAEFSRQDYYAEEQQKWNQAAESLYDMIGDVAGDKIHNRIGRRG